ncbi:MAG: hypothetical protein WBM69_05235 [Desulfobacterales bacterium]
MIAKGSKIIKKGAFLWLISPQVNFLTAFGFGVIGTISFAIAGTDLTDDAGQYDN